ncbi:hypothetical protein B0T16DRAFT_408586 [Cercophora newfieldiana]|uniref:Uncharacterized protein n=1 Tax=Cercophora newfieldiana TaxID=92897 RepID=A0AA39Y9R2_9PEZI|nr:hypothetical protein B0T16DRAFT_408586 [Cercophora newfieldiana]
MQQRMPGPRARCCNPRWLATSSNLTRVASTAFRLPPPPPLDWTDRRCGSTSNSASDPRCWRQNQHSPRRHLTNRGRRFASCNYSNAYGHLYGARTACSSTMGWNSHGTGFCRHKRRIEGMSTPALAPPNVHPFLLVVGACSRNLSAAECRRVAMRSSRVHPRHSQPDWKPGFSLWQCLDSGAHHGCYSRPRAATRSLAATLFRNRAWLTAHSSSAKHSD